MDISLTFVTIFCFFNFFEENDYPITISQNETEINNGSCSYDILVDSLTQNRQNFYTLQTSFFPPQSDIPLYVTVTYNFPDNSSIDYIWSTASLYFTVHPRILSFLSLFFSYIEDDRIANVKLELPEACSSLINNTKSDKTNFLFVLTHRLRFYIQVSTEYEDLEANVVAVQNLKAEYDTKFVRVFFSLVIVLPILILLFIWLSIPGAIPYIRSYINNSENFSSIASVYWIGQIFTIFVIIMDGVAWRKSIDLPEMNQLERYQFNILKAIVIIEGGGLLYNFLCLLFPLFSHCKCLVVKERFEDLFNLIGGCCIFCCILSFRRIGRKEARVWIVLSCLITPIIAMSSHAGFIVGGWVSYEDRSVAIVLLFLFILVFLYWTIQYMYQMFNTCITYKRRNKLKPRCFSCLKKTKEYDPEKGAYHYERELYTVSVLTNLFGFDTIALCTTSVFVLLACGFVIILGVGILYPLLSTIDEALVHIFKLGNFIFVIIAFLLTYKVLAVKNGEGGAARLISNDALKYWKFLVRNQWPRDHIADLQLAMKRLKLSLDAISEDNMVIGDNRNYEIQCVIERLGYAMDHFGIKDDENREHQHNHVVINDDENREHTPQHYDGINDDENGTDPLNNPSSNLGKIARRMKKFCKNETIALTDFTQSIDEWIRSVNEITNEFTEGRAGMNPEGIEKLHKGIKELCAGVNIFRKTLVRALGVPPMYYNKDQANALAAALVYEKVNNRTQLQGAVNNPIQPRGAKEENRRTLLLSLIEENL